MQCLQIFKIIIIIPDFFILVAVPPLRPNGTDLTISKGKNGVVLTSDESEEDEFCDTIDPEHLQELQNGNHHEGPELNLEDTLQGVDSAQSSNNSNSSPERATNSTLTESENSDSESELKTSQLLTSTPYAKHVTFAIESSDSDRSSVVKLSQSEAVVSEESILEVNPVLENGHDSEAGVAALEDDSFTPIDDDSQRPSGILKSHHPVRECGGGDASQQPPGRSHVSRTRQTQGARNKEGKHFRSFTQVGFVRLFDVKENNNNNLKVDCIVRVKFWFNLHVNFFHKIHKIFHRTKSLISQGSSCTIHVVYPKY